MKKAVLMSIKPKWCELIASGKKTIEVRKTRPKLEPPFKCYIYETKGKSDVPTWMDEEGHVAYECGGKVIGEFVCDTYVIDKTFGHDDLFNKAACLSAEEAAAWSTNKSIYGWHISDLNIYDEPKELSEFHKPILPTGLRYEDDVIKRPPQSWCYVEEAGRNE